MIILLRAVPQDMQRPHDSLLEKNPSFAELFPKVQARFDSFLTINEDHDLEKELNLAYVQWTRLKIMWDELQLLVSQEKHADVSD